VSANLIPLVKAALETRLAGVLPGVPVSWGTKRGVGGREWVVIGDVDGPQSAVVVGRGSSGAGPRREQNLTVLVQVFVNGRDLETPEALTTRAFELVDAIETEVRRDPGLGVGDGHEGVPYVHTGAVVRTDLRESTDGDQRTSRVDVYVQAQGRS
jgi:hypothetical protein